MNARHASVPMDKISAILFLSGIIGTLIGLYSNTAVINFTAIGAPLVLTALYLLRKYLLLWFFVFLYIVYVFPYALIFLGGGDFSSWRQGQISGGQNVKALADLAHMTCIGVMMVGFGQFFRLKQGKVAGEIGVSRGSSVWFGEARLFMYVLSLVPFGIFFQSVFGRNRNALLESAGASDVAMLNIAFMLIYLCGGYFIGSWMVDRKWRLGFSMPLLASLLFASTGFRYCLIGLILIGATAYMHKNSVRLRKLLLFSALGIAVYFLLTVLALSRNSDLGAFDVLRGFLTGDIQLSLLLTTVGAHEQNIYYSFLETLSHERIYYGALYLDAIIRVLPSFVYGELFQATRVNDVIAVISAPTEMIGAGLNLGAFFLAEAYLNFGTMGMYMVFLGSIVLLDGIEERKDRSFSWLMAYFVIVASVPNYIYYGLNPIIKFAVYSMVLVFMVRLIAGYRGR